MRPGMHSSDFRVRPLMDRMRPGFHGNNLLVIHTCLKTAYLPHMFHKFTRLLILVSNSRNKIY